MNGHTKSSFSLVLIRGLVESLGVMWGGRNKICYIRTDTLNQPFHNHSKDDLVQSNTASACSKGFNWFSFLSSYNEEHLKLYP